MGPASQLGESKEGGRLIVGEGSPGVIPVPGHDDASRHLCDPGRGLRPIERIAVAEEGDRPVLEQVAGKEDVRIGHADHDVVIRMTSALSLIHI